MKRSYISFITKTALLLAIVIMFQMFGRLFQINQFIVGPIVNACLIIAISLVGLKGAAVIAIISPFASLINNNAPVATALLPFSPFIAISNLVFVILFFLLMKKSKIAGVAVGAVIKFALLFGSIRLFLRLFDFPKFATKLIEMFSWPQLVTALIGGALAIIIISALQKAKVINAGKEE